MAPPLELMPLRLRLKGGGAVAPDRHGPSITRQANTSVDSPSKGPQTAPSKPPSTPESRWTPVEDAALISLVPQHTSHGVTLWSSVATGMSRLGFPRPVRSCRTRRDKLRKRDGLPWTAKEDAVVLREASRWEKRVRWSFVTARLKDAGYWRNLLDVKARCNFLRNQNNDTLAENPHPNREQEHDADVQMTDGNADKENAAAPSGDGNADDSSPADGRGGGDAEAEEDVITPVVTPSLGRVAAQKHRSMLSCAKVIVTPSPTQADDRLEDGDRDAAPTRVRGLSRKKPRCTILQNPFLAILAEKKALGQPMEEKRIEDRTTSDVDDPRSSKDDGSDGADVDVILPVARCTSNAEAWSSPKQVSAPEQIDADVGSDMEVESAPLTPSEDVEVESASPMGDGPLEDLEDVFGSTREPTGTDCDDEEDTVTPGNDIPRSSTRDITPAVEASPSGANDVRDKTYVRSERDEGSDGIMNGSTLRSPAMEEEEEEEEGEGDEISPAANPSRNRSEVAEDSTSQAPLDKSQDPLRHLTYFVTEPVDSLDSSGAVRQHRRWTNEEDEILLRCVRRRKSPAASKWHHVALWMTQNRFPREANACALRARKLCSDDASACGVRLPLPPGPSKASIRQRSKSAYEFRSWSAAEEDVLLACLARKCFEKGNLDDVEVWMGAGGYPRSASACSQRAHRLRSNAERRGEEWLDLLKGHHSRNGDGSTTGRHARDDGKGSANSAGSERQDKPGSSEEVAGDDVGNKASESGAAGEEDGTSGSPSSQQRWMKEAVEGENSERPLVGDGEEVEVDVEEKVRDGRNKGGGTTPKPNTAEVTEEGTILVAQDGITSESAAKADDIVRDTSEKMRQIASRVVVVTATVDGFSGCGAEKATEATAPPKAMPSLAGNVGSVGITPKTAIGAGTSDMPQGNPSSFVFKETTANDDVVELGRLPSEDRTRTASPPHESVPEGLQSDPPSTGARSSVTAGESLSPETNLVVMEVAGSRREGRRFSQPKTRELQSSTERPVALSGATSGNKLWTEKEDEALIVCMRRREGIRGEWGKVSNWMSEQSFLRSWRACKDRAARLKSDAGNERAWLMILDPERDVSKLTIDHDKSGEGVPAEETESSSRAVGPTPEPQDGPDGVGMAERGKESGKHVEQTEVVAASPRRAKAVTAATAVVNSGVGSAAQKSTKAVTADNVGLNNLVNNESASAGCSKTESADTTDANEDTSEHGTEIETNCASPKQVCAGPSRAAVAAAEMVRSVARRRSRRRVETAVAQQANPDPPDSSSDVDMEESDSGGDSEWQPSSGGNTPQRAMRRSQRKTMPVTRRRSKALDIPPAHVEQKGYRLTRRRIVPIPRSALPPASQSASVLRAWLKEEDELLLRLVAKRARIGGSWSDVVSWMEDEDVIRTERAVQQRAKKLQVDAEGEGRVWADVVREAGIHDIGGQEHKQKLVAKGKEPNSKERLRGDATNPYYDSLSDGDESLGDAEAVGPLGEIPTLYSVE